MNSDPAAAHRELRQTVRDFATAVVKPLASRTDHEHRFPTEALSAAAELDLMGILLPAEYGGAGPAPPALSVFLEENAPPPPNTAVHLHGHNPRAPGPAPPLCAEGEKRAGGPRA